MAQAEVLNQESLAKQVLQETFGYQQFRPAETIIETALEAGTARWSCRPVAASRCAIRCRRWSWAV
ncbi:hypothetical protein J4734_08735 [Klebsiella pneumoniae]|uniref:Uncharacterized protein n=1 Tax=Klebsiella pneumoniae TaxID=573 RepID=A0A939NNT9_KLEPN|nr:hypothetical protein [Klebsiella pneumoniae]